MKRRAHGENDKLLSKAHIWCEQQQQIELTSDEQGKRGLDSNTRLH